MKVTGECEADDDASGDDEDEDEGEDVDVPHGNVVHGVMGQIAKVCKLFVVSALVL